MQILTSIHFSDHRYSCIQTHRVQTHICLCPRECSHFEPLCIHSINPQIYIYRMMYTVETGIHGAETHIWLCPCERSQLEPLCLHANTHKYTFLKLTFVCALALARAHTSNLVFIHAIFQKYIYNSLHIFEIYRMMDAFVQESTVRKLTYVYALASAHS